MDWQQLTALFIVTATAFVFAWRWGHRRRRVYGGSVPCGCAGADRDDVPPVMVFRARKGARREIVIKAK